MLIRCRAPTDRETYRKEAGDGWKRVLEERGEKDPEQRRSDWPQTWERQHFH